MTLYRTLTVAALSLSALAAQAGSLPSGDGEGANAQAPRTLPREAVIADLVASRKAGTMPADNEWYNVPAPLGYGRVQAGAKPAASSSTLVNGGQKPAEPNPPQGAAP